MNTYLLCGTGQPISLGGINGYQNGVGLLDSICESCYSDTSFPVVQCRNMKVLDLQDAPSRNQSFTKREEDLTNWTSPDIDFYEGDIPTFPTVAEQDMQRRIYSGYKTGIIRHLSGGFDGTSFYESSYRVPSKHTTPDVTGWLSSRIHFKDSSKCTWLGGLVILSWDKYTTHGDDYGHFAGFVGRAQPYYWGPADTAGYGNLNPTAQNLLPMVILPKNRITLLRNASGTTTYNMFVDLN